MAEQQCVDYSIWTVDLAYLLRRSGLSVELMTITLGANPDYASEGFYKEHIHEDGSRVERLFRVSRDAAFVHAKSAAWPLHQLLSVLLLF